MNTSGTVRIQEPFLSALIFFLWCRWDELEAAVDTLVAVGLPEPPARSSEECQEGLQVLGVRCDCSR